MESASAAVSPAGEPAHEKGLKKNAIGFVDALVIGLASTAPAYSLAAVIGALAVGVGVQAPAVLLASFLPMSRRLETFAAPDSQRGASR